MPTSEQIEKAAIAMAECDPIVMSMLQQDEAHDLARAALSAAEVKPRAITVSDRLAEELKTWAEDERAAWPTDTAFQDDLADLLAQLSALQEGE